MSKVVSTLPTIWEEDVYTVLRLLKRHVDFINDELIPAINDNADDITALKTDVANIKTQIQSISVEIDGISDTLEAYRLEFAEIKNDIDSINTKITTINSSIVTINRNITSISNNVSVLENATQALSVDMVQVKSDVKSLSDKINALENLKYVVVDTTDTWQIPSAHYNYYVTTNIPVDTLNILLPSQGPGSGKYKTQKIYITSFWQGASGNLVLMTSSGTMRPFKIGYDSATGTGATTITIPSGLTSSTWFGELTIVYKAGDTTTNNAFVRFD